MFANFLIPQLDLHLTFVESQLATVPGGGKYLCGGHLTVADILMSYPLMEARDKGHLMNPRKGDKKWEERYPKVWEYLKKLESEEGFRRAEERINEMEKGAK